MCIHIVRYIAMYVQRQQYSSSVVAMWIDLEKNQKFPGSVHSVTLCSCCSYYFPRQETLLGSSSWPSCIREWVATLVVVSKTHRAV